MENRLSINQWAEDDRPREKLLRLGASALSDAELLAILVGSGSTKQSAVDLMKQILSDSNNNLNQLGQKTIDELTQYHGMGTAKAVTIMAACELGKRRWNASPEKRPSILSARDAYEYLWPRMGDLPIEEFWVILLNQRNKVIRSVRISQGGLTATMVDMRLILREALLANAPCIIVAHNHPSGSILPSKEDNHLTVAILQACQTMNIMLQDHIIVTDGNYYSYRDDGQL